MKGKRVEAEDAVGVLRDNGTPMTNKMLAEMLDCTPETASKACKRARAEGYLILPTSDGQWYVRKIQTHEDLNRLLAAWDWMVREKGCASHLLSFGKRALQLIPTKWQDEVAVSV